jgi:lipopolysaccharide transport system permease protein
MPDTMKRIFLPGRRRISPWKRPDRRVSPYSTSLLAPVWCLYAYRHAIRRFAITEIHEKYRSTFLGIFWFLLTPLLYLAAFWLVFGYIIPGREVPWPGLGEGNVAFLSALYSGLIVFWFFSGIIGPATNIIPKNSHLVREIVFPTEMLPWVSTVTASIEMGVHLLLLLLLYVLQFGAIPWTAVAVPLVMLPLAMMLTGFAWMLAAFGARVKDVGQLVQVGVTAMLFLSAVFFPAEQVPEEFRWLFLFNPVARTISDLRNLVFSGTFPDPAGLLVYLLLAYLTMIVGYRIFKRHQPKFPEYL